MANRAEDRRKGERFVISFPIRVKWRGPDGKEIIQDGLTENVGPHGTLVYLPRSLPSVGGKVKLTVTEDPKAEVTVSAEVIRLERNAAHPQAALQLIDGMREWKRKVWDLAARTIAEQEPEQYDADW
jgi:hypothetical protein